MTTPLPGVWPWFVTGGVGMVLLLWVLGKELFELNHFFREYRDFFLKVVLPDPKRRETIVYMLEATGEVLFSLVPLLLLVATLGVVVFLVLW